MEGENRNNPYDSAGVFSRIFFCWLFPLLLKGRKRRLQENDLYATSKYHSSQYLGDLLQKEWDKEIKLENPSLTKAILRFIGWKYMLLCLLPVIQEAVLVPVQAYVLGLLVNYYDHAEESNKLPMYITIVEFYVLAGMFLLTFLTHLIISEMLGMKIKIAFSTIMYRKAIRLSASSLAKSNIGQMVSLLGNDVTKFYYNIFSLAYVFADPLIIVAVVAILWQYFGWTILVGISTIFIFVPIQLILGKVYSKLRLQIAKAGDERLNLLNEMIAGMRLIKMYTWEKPFTLLIENARKKEIRKVKTSLYLRGIAQALSYSFSKLFSCLTFLVFFFYGGHLTAQIVFVNMSLSICLFRSIFYMFSIAVTQFADNLTSIKRLQDFLLLPEKDNRAIIIKEDKSNGTKCGIWMKDITAAWNNENNTTLKAISLDVQVGELLVVVGSIGSGKTSLLMAILGEIPICSGEVVVNGKIAYASQEAWLFNGTIRENILFGDEYREDKYNEVLYITALEKDISLFPKGDLTRVGERGTTMSGGQKARINLARALYRDADIFILDDPLSAVDTPVATHIFEKCIMKYLSNKICILVTHQIHFLQYATKILVLKQGNCAASGDYNKIMNSGIDLGISAKNEKCTQKEMAEEELLNTKDVDIFHSVEIENTANHVKEENVIVTKDNEENSFKSLGISVYKAYIDAGANLFFKIMILFFLIVSQALTNGGDIWLLKWVKDEATFTKNIENFTLAINNGNETGGEDFLRKREFNVYVYVELIFGLLVVTFISVSLFYEMSMAASINLHRNMFRCIIRTPITFLDMNPIGKIINRFSKDMMSVDEVLSYLFQHVIRMIALLLGIFIVEAIINVYLLIFTIVLTIVFYFLWTFHTRALKSIKYLEGKARSPVFSHLSASLYGLTIIRAFKVENNFKIAFNQFQDKHTATWFLYVAINSWISIYGELICFINLIIIIVMLDVMKPTENAGSKVGLALNYGILVFLYYPWLVRQKSEIDYQMNSVSRILNYSKLNSEAAYESSPDKQPPFEWPERGEIKYDNVSLRYSKDKSEVLKELTFHIYPGEKIGIVGRTGAGKSSVIAALFRLIEPTGKITIDGINTKDIGLRDLRSKMSIIPQDPVLFTGPLRRNIDPFNEYSEERLWQVIEEVQLKQVVGKLPGGLDTILMEGGRNFSVGQRQLICLARAVLRQNNILVLDEATSNMDKITDSLIQKIIREKFEFCTVLTIAHRLNTIIDSDRVLVLDAGEIQEFDKPHVLLKNVRGVFYNLVKKTGQTSMKELCEIAKDKYFCKEIVIKTKL
ncbi:ATP-binding cassette sub-family C member 4-like [Centruroides vittatus]|uniref:ATP-binding cassette sub-family C member 4-like n=1 Tax=Centruroides vittatus TaxID=120091 RepID=UPI00350FBCF1